MGKRKTNGEDTDVTIGDVVRELREISTKLDKLDSIDRKLDSALRRDQAFEARPSKLETAMEKLKKKRL